MPMVNGTRVNGISALDKDRALFILKTKTLIL